jgi:hypothetical protein
VLSPCFRIVSIAGWLTSAWSTSCSMTDKSDLTNMPPLKAAIGVVNANGAINISMPRGGRPLVIANWIPASRILATAARARSVSTFSWVTRAPSTSARRRRIVVGAFDDTLLVVAAGVDAFIYYAALVCCFSR